MLSIPADIRSWKAGRHDKLVGTYCDTKLDETVEEVVGDGDSVFSDRGLEALLWLEGLQFMTKTGDLDLEVRDGLESHSTFYWGWV